MLKGKTRTNQGVMYGLTQKKRVPFNSHLGTWGGGGFVVCTTISLFYSVFPSP